MLTFALGVSLASSAAGAVVGTASAALAGPRGWREMRWISAAAWTASAFAACSALPLISASPSVAIAATGCQYALASLHVLAWLLGAAAPLRLRKRTLWGWSALILSLALCVAIPGLAFREPIHTRTVAWLGSVYRDPTPTLLANFAAALLVALLASLSVLHLRAWRRGVRHTAASGVALGLLAALGAQDALAIAGVVDSPDLLAPGALAPVVVIASLLTSRFVADARGLARLRERLQRRIQARTRVLALSRDALRRIDGLAELGRLASRAAHEVNNPAACVMANLSYAAEQLAREDAPVPDVVAALKDTQEALQRLRVLAGRLSDSGGAEPKPPRRVPLAEVVADAVALAGGQSRDVVRIEVDVDRALTAAGDPAILCRALVELISNAVRAAAARPAGSVVIRAKRDHARVSLRIVDDGGGMDEVVLRRLGEPFFTTRPFESSGLGVAVGRALIRSLGGRLRIESARGAGTTAILDLPATPRAARQTIPEQPSGQEEAGTWSAP
jgi:signal transduction histidine kinase